MRALILLISMFFCTQASAQNACKMQNGTPIFCETFDQKNPGIPSRTGDLDPNVWGVSRTTGTVNFGSQQWNDWASTLIQKCDGTVRVVPTGDVIICNGQLREASNDNVDGGFEAGSVITLTMYPKQPFDFAGRTGVVSFDVSNDTAGTHAAWPEFWLTDLPVPAPFNHFDSWIAFPQNGLGIRFGAGVGPGNVGSCQNSNNLNQSRWTVDSAVVIRNYVYDDTNGYGTRTSMQVQQLDCVISSPGPNGPLNHIELKIAQNQIEVWASDAGSTALRKIAIITNTNLSLTRGLIWLEDVHYNADKGDPTKPSQREHTFTWDNVAFDGPFTYRDFSYDALDNTAPGPNGSVNLGKISLPNQSTNWNVVGLPAGPQAAAVRVLFNFFHYDAPSVLTVSVNGHVHTQPWPYPGNQGFTWRTDAITIPITDLVTGTNVVTIGADQAIVTANVDIVLVNVPGGVPVMPGSNNNYPGGTAINGVCGPANGTTVPTAPTTGLCSAGTASAVSGTGPWTWLCAGSNGGTSAACAAQKTAPPTNTCSVVGNVPTCTVANCTHIGTNATGQMICKD